MREFSKTEEKILDTALRIVANKGSFNITVRELSSKAGVNIGAVNYYFDTKDQMVELLKEFYIENTIDAYSVISDKSLSNSEKIRRFSHNVILYCLKYPGILNILREAYAYQDNDKGFKKIVDTTNKLNDELEIIFEELFIDLTDEEYELKKNVFLSSIIYPALNMDIFQLDKELMTDENRRTAYVEYVLKLLDI